MQELDGFVHHDVRQVPTLDQLDLRPIPVLPQAAELVERIGEPVVGRAEQDDPGAVVVDEVVGQWLTLLPIAYDLWLYPVGFVLFRIFDVVKPWPIGWIDREVKGGFGIMADDVVAGLYAAALCYGLSYWTGPVTCFPWTC